MVVYPSCLICLPPLVGWNDWPVKWTAETPCKLTSERGYVVYSSMGSFYIPLAVIITLYAKIYRSTKQRLRTRAKSSNLTILRKVTNNVNRDGQGTPVRVEVGTVLKANGVEVQTVDNKFYTSKVKVSRIRQSLHGPNMQLRSTSIPSYAKCLRRSAAFAKKARKGCILRNKFQKTLAEDYLRFSHTCLCSE